MIDKPQFKRAFPFQEDVLALPVKDLDVAAEWYSNVFGMKEIKRLDEPNPTVILKRDGAEIGFAINGGDATQDGAAILVSGIDQIKKALEAKGVEIGNGELMSETEKSIKSSLWLRLTGFVFIFISRFRASRQDG